MQPGDTIPFRGCTATVLATGADGATVEHHGEVHQVLWSSLTKALDGERHDIWSEHESPFIRALIEQFTTKGLDRVAEVRSALQRWAEGRYYVPDQQVQKPHSWYLSTRELELARIYLSSIEPAAMTLQDWSYLIDYLVQRYLPPDELTGDAEWLTSKAYMLGKAQAAGAGMTDALLAAAPATIKGVANLLQRSAPLILEYGTERACDSVVALSEVNRHRLKRVIVEHQKNRLSGTNTGKLQQELFDTFADWNRDWRRIAVTEAGEMANQGIIAGLKPGARVKRIEQYHGACAFCKKIDGRVMNVVSPDDPNKNGETDIWVGKTNVGRSQSPNKIVDGKLVPRGPDELWWVPAGLAHPHCRGRYEPLAEPQPGDDPAFAAWLDKTLTEALA